MRYRLKIFTSLLFMASALLPLLLSLFLSLEKDRIRKSMEKDFESKELQTLRVPENEVRWMDDHEIWVNNKMFDILASKLEEGVYTFTGLYDHEETRLVDMEKRSSPFNEKQTTLLGRVLKSLPAFVSEPVQSIEPIPVTIYSRFTDLSPENGYYRIITPPPRS